MNWWWKKKNYGAKFCAQCRYFAQPYSYAASIGKCTHRRSLQIHDYLVTGDITDIKNYQYASINRLPGGICGYAGKLWESTFIDGEVVQADAAITAIGHKNH